MSQLSQQIIEDAIPLQVAHVPDTSVHRAVSVLETRYNTLRFLPCFQFSLLCQLSWCEGMQ